MDSGRRNLDPEVLYLLIVLLVGVYVFVINYFAPSTALGGWFARHVPWPLAIFNVAALACLFIVLTIYSPKVPLSWRYALLLAFAGLGSFLELSISSAPITSWVVILVAGLIYSVLWRRNKRSK